MQQITLTHQLQRLLLWAGTSNPRNTQTWALSSLLVLLFRELNGHLNLLWEGKLVHICVAVTHFTAPVVLHPPSFSCFVTNDTLKSFMLCLRSLLVLYPPFCPAFSPHPSHVLPWVMPWQLTTYYCANRYFLFRNQYVTRLPNNPLLLPPLESTDILNVCSLLLYKAWGNWKIKTFGVANWTGSLSLFHSCWDMSL